MHLLLILAVSLTFHYGAALPPPAATGYGPPFQYLGANEFMKTRVRQLRIELLGDTVNSANHSFTRPYTDPHLPFDSSNFRGAVYVQSDARNALDMWARLNLTKVSFELGLAARAGFTFIRVFAHHLAFRKDETRKYDFSLLDEFLETAHNAGIPYVMPVIFDGCGFPYSAPSNPPVDCRPSSTRPKFSDHTKPCWLADPGWAVQNEEEGMRKMEAYVAELGRWYESKTGQEKDAGHRPTLFDVNNEPECAGHYLNWDFVHRMTDVLRKTAPSIPLTVGLGWPNSMEEQMSLMDKLHVLSYHTYQQTFAEGLSSAEYGVSISHKYRKPVFNSETGCYSLGTAYDSTIRAYDQYSMGWTVWELMVSDCKDCADRRRERTGLFYPETGGVRDAMGILAVRKLYPETDHAILAPPVLRNRFEQRSTEALKNAKAFVGNETENVAEGLVLLDELSEFVHSVGATPLAWPLRAEVRRLQGLEENSANPDLRKSIQRTLREVAIPALEGVIDGKESYPGRCQFQDAKAEDTSVKREGNSGLDVVV